MEEKMTKTNWKESFAGRFGGKRAGDDPMRKLTRMELLELLIEQTKENENLIRKNEELTENLNSTKAELAKCKEDIERVASLDVILSRLETVAGVLDPLDEGYHDSIRHHLADQEILDGELPEDAEFAEDSEELSEHRAGILRRWGLKK